MPIAPIRKAVLTDPIRKSAITTSTLASGGILSREQFNAFINMVWEYSRFLDTIRTVTVTNKSGEIDKLGYGAPISRGATEATAFTATKQPTFSKVLYDCLKLASAYDISTETEEDNIEGAQIRNTIMTAFSTQVAIDHTDLAINGDSSLEGTDDYSMLRKVNDGLHILTTLAPNYIDANGKGISLKLLRDGLNKLPEKYRGRLEGRLKWFIPTNPLTDMMYELGSRATTGGDSVYSQAPRLAPFGIGINEEPMFPKDLTIGTAATDGTFILLSDPNNLIWFIRRRLAMHFLFQPRSDLTEVTAYSRTDFQIEDINALVKIRSVSADASTAY
jgi:hypothetical protein